MGGHLSLADGQRLQALHREITGAYKQLVGYPVAVDFSLAELRPFADLVLNNIGDPWVLSRCAHHSKVLEQEVVAFFAALFRASPGEAWGYVTNGGTEGNLYALYVARELYPDAVAYYAATAHYSVPKSLRLLGIPGVAVTAQPHGEMDYLALRRELTARRTRPAVVVATIGTTMTEAKDDLFSIRRALREAGITDYFIHCDGALAAPYTALLAPRHPFDFADGADAISVSGHKFIGSPMPCGVVLVRKEHQARLGGATVQYLGTHDTTISGSRNGHTPILLWCAIRKYGREGLRQRAMQGLRLAERTSVRLRQLGWPTWRNPNALTVMLATPPAEVTSRWMMASSGGWSHLICMPGMQRRQVDAFLADLAAVSPPRVSLPRPAGLPPAGNGHATPARKDRRKVNA